MRDSNFRFQHTAHARDEDEGILPLINVVFLLLIFFIIVGSFSQVDPFTIEPIVSDATEALEETPLVIHMGAEGQLAIGEHNISMEQLPEELQAIVGDTVPETMWIKAHGAADATRLVLLMEQLRSAGVKRLHLLTIQREL